MAKHKKHILHIKEEDSSSATVEIEVDDKFIEFYKKETNRNRVTDKGLSLFIENLIKLYAS